MLFQTGRVFPLCKVTQSAGEKSTTVTAPRGQAFNKSEGPCRSIVDLVKAYSIEKGKFCGEKPEMSLRMVRSSIACKLMYVSLEDSPRAYIHRHCSRLLVRVY
jgi:hypothetical protein